MPMNSWQIHHLTSINWDWYGIYIIPYHPHEFLVNLTIPKQLSVQKTTMGLSQGSMEINGRGACPDLGVRIADQIEQCLSMVGSLPSPNASNKMARCQGTSSMFLGKSENSLVYHLNSLGMGFKIPLVHQNRVPLDHRGSPKAHESSPSHHHLKMAAMFTIPKW